MKGWASPRSEFEKKDEQINMRVPKPLLAAVKARAKDREESLQEMLIKMLEQYCTREGRTPRSQQ